MIQIQKRQLSKIILFSFPVLSLLHAVLLFLLFKKAFLFIIFSYSLACLVLLIINTINKKKINVLTIKTQDLIERVNLLGESIEKEKLLLFALDKKSSKYSLLKQTLDKFSQSLLLEQVGKTIVEETYDLFGGIGSVIMYLFNRDNNMLDIAFTRRVIPEIVIKEKHGDIFDEWVLKHNQPLLVEDTAKDFRFDPELIRKRISRQVSSVIIAPLLVPNRFIGIIRVESYKASNFTSEDLRFLSTISNLISISLENAILFKHSAELAMNDGLTGLHLRRFLNDRGNEEVQYASKKKHNLSLLMIDIDNFKTYNDRFGHRSGDIVLMHIADLLRGVFHDKRYIISRFGGEEFCVLLPMTGKKDALTLAESFRKGIQDGIIFLRRTPVRITVSIGVASYPTDVNSWLDLVNQSDAAMYKAKQEGKNKVCSA